MMDSILQFFADLKDSLTGLNQLILLGTSLSAVALFFLRGFLKSYRNRRFLVKRLMPFYTEMDVRRATEIYIPTMCQDIDPAQEEEPRSVHAFAAKNELIPLLTRKLESGEADKYYIVLADSGMGKTTFLLNFFLRYARKWRSRYQIRLFPLGDPRTEGAIDRIEDQEGTVLLLDAFDEDGLAIIDYAERLDELIRKTSNFPCVVMSSRTQFFPSHVQEPAKTGILKHGGDKGEHEFKKFYLSPFDGKVVNRFIRKKYRLFEWRKRRRARAIVNACPYLMVRPMLLAYIDDLMEEGGIYEYPHQIYEAMVHRWIERERVENKEDLRRFSEAIAIHMYHQQKKRKGLFVESVEVEAFAERHSIRLQEFELKGRSLLNRDAEGRVKFAHKTILEYFLALELVRNPRFSRGFQFERMKFASQLVGRLAWEKQWRPSLARFKEKAGRLRGFSGAGGYKPLHLLAIESPQDVTELNLWNVGITNLAPLVWFTALRSLRLDSNNISDVAPLARLTNLQTLDLHNNNISDVAPLAQLTNLQKLDLDMNNISDAELRNLRTALRGCRISYSIRYPLSRSKATRHSIKNAG